MPCRFRANAKGERLYEGSPLASKSAMIEGITILEHIRTCQNQVFKAMLDGELCILRLTSTDHRSVDQLRTETRFANGSA